MGLEVIRRLVRKPTFIVVTLVVAALVVFGVGGRVLTPLVPKTAQNDLAGESAWFLKQAGTEAIQWRSYGPEVLDEARSKDQIVMLVIGAPWSAFGREADEKVFSDQEVQELLRRNFVCARVDLVDRPEFRSALLPLSRVKANYLNGFQAWFLDGQGRLIDSYLSGGYGTGADSRSFLLAANLARKRFGAQRRGDATAEPAGADQLADMAAIANSAEAGLPPYTEHIAALTALAQPDGGFLDSGYRDLFPNAWRYLLLTGQKDLVVRNIEPVISSPVVDVLDGGFFRAAKQKDWTQPEYDKIAVTNAEMMQMLAMATVATGNPAYRALAERTFDALASEFLDNDTISATRVGDEQPNTRSNRSSFSPRNLRDMFSDGAQRDRVRSFFGLYVESNPQALLRYPKLSTVLSDSGWQAETLRFLRETRESQMPPFTGKSQLDVTGFAVARMIQCARMWGDQARLKKALRLVDGLEAFRSGDDVSHRLGARITDHPYLGDYLAYADACAQDFLATGRLLSLQNGSAILNRALVLFGTRKPGFFQMVSDSSYLPPGADAPEILDFQQESTTAQTIRLTQVYGTLTKGALSAEFHRAAFSGAGAFASSARRLGPYVSGYFCACAIIQDSAHAVCVGPNAQDLSQALYARVPTRLVATAVGDVFAEFQSKKPGIYVLRNGTTSGPFTVAEAAANLGFTLDVGQPAP